MTTSGFPGMGGLPGGPQAMQPAPGAGVGFVLDIPPDPTWEPFEAADVLEKDGYYCCQITAEKPRSDPGKSAGIFLTLVLQDEDVRGKTLSRFLPDPRTSQGNVWFIWRGLIRSIYGTMDAARSGLRYTANMFTGAYVYVKAERQIYKERDTTSIDTWITQKEWEDARAAGRHRWAPKATNNAGGSPVGALPGGVPGGFPGMGQGLPGAPTNAGGVPAAGGGLPGMPTQAATPQPGVPMAPAAAPPPPAAVAPTGFPAPPAMAPPPPAAVAPAGFPAPAAAPPAATPQPGGFQFANFPGMPAAPPVNGAPAPTAAGIVGSFPPGPGGAPQQ